MSVRLRDLKLCDEVVRIEVTVFREDLIPFNQVSSRVGTKPKTDIGPRSEGGVEIRCLQVRCHRRRCFSGS